MPGFWSWLKTVRVVRMEWVLSCVCRAGSGVEIKMPFSIFANFWISENCHSQKNLQNISIFLKNHKVCRFSTKKIWWKYGKFWKAGTLFAFALVLHLFCENIRENNVFAEKNIHVIVLPLSVKQKVGSALQEQGLEAEKQRVGKCPFLI